MAGDRTHHRSRGRVVDPDSDDDDGGEGEDVDMDEEEAPKAKKGKGKATSRKADGAKYVSTYAKSMASHPVGLQIPS